MARKQQSKREPTAEERREQQEAGMRAEANALAHHANPLQAGEELADGSDARKEKLALKKQGSRK